MATPDASKPAVIFDGDCGFCRYWVRRWQDRAAQTVEFFAFQDPVVPARYPNVSIERARRAVQFVDVDGSVSEGAEAVFRVLASGGRTLPLRVYDALPPFAFAAELAYRIVAAHRPFFS